MGKNLSPFSNLVSVCFCSLPSSCYLHKSLFKRLPWVILSLNFSYSFPEIGPPHHHPGHRMPHPGISEHPPWGGPQHPDFGPPPHGFNGQPPHMRRQGPPHVNHDDPSLVPNVPYFDLPAGLMAPLVKVSAFNDRFGNNWITGCPRKSCVLSQAYGLFSWMVVGEARWRLGW